MKREEIESQGGAPLDCVVCGDPVDYDNAVFVGAMADGEPMPGSGPAHSRCRRAKQETYLGVHSIRSVLGHL